MLVSISFFRAPPYVSSQDVSLAALYVSTKMHDTLKKPRELLAVSYAILYPDLAAKSKHPGGEVDLDTMDPNVRRCHRLCTSSVNPIYRW